MKKHILFVTFLFLSTLTFAQNTNFEGRIVYKNKFSLPNGQDITAGASQQMGAEQDYYINAKNYKSILNGAAVKMQLYKSAENKYYMIAGNNSVQVFDGSMETDKITKIEQLNGTFDILGRKCKGIIMIGSTAKTTYYFDENLKIDPSVYAKHNFGNWNDYMKASNGALPLKFIVENIQFTWEATATKIETRSIPDSEFELPKDAKLK
jgi:hypothetical protein